MLFTTHAIVGAAIGVASKNPALGFVSAFIMHHIMDAIPHFDQGSFYVTKSGAPYLNHKCEMVPRFDFTRRDWILLFIDFIIGGIAIAFLFYQIPTEFWVPLVAGMLGGLLPDIIDTSPLWSKYLRERYRAIFYFHKFHIFFHWTIAKNEALLGLTTQLLLIVVSLWYLAIYIN